LNVENYTIEELTDLLGIEVLDELSIKEAVQKQKKEHPSKKSIAFFNAIEEKLIKSIDVPDRKK